jgi:prolyl 4-hydroxylase
VLVGEGFVTPEEAQELIRDFEGLLARSTVYGENGSNETESSRTSSTAYLPPGEPGTLVERLERRAAALLGVPMDHLETLQLLRYEPSQKYDAHWDFFRTGPDAANNRTKTALVYLNDLETGDAGGSTRFPKLNLEVKPALGRVVVWHNCAAEPGKAAVAKDCDDRTLHAGEPPERSVKYAINIWARNLPAR